MNHLFYSEFCYLVPQIKFRFRNSVFNQATATVHKSTHLKEKKKLISFLQLEVASGILFWYTWVSVVAMQWAKTKFSKRSLVLQDTILICVQIFVLLDLWFKIQQRFGFKGKNHDNKLTLINPFIYLTSLTDVFWKMSTQKYFLLHIQKDSESKQDFFSHWWSSLSQESVFVKTCFRVLLDNSLNVLEFARGNKRRNRHKGCCGGLYWILEVGHFGCSHLQKPACKASKQIPSCPHLVSVCIVTKIFEITWGKVHQPNV